MTIRKLIIATAITTGTLMGSISTVSYAANHNSQQSAGEYASDAVITTKVKGAFVAQSALSALDISVETINGNVTLSGTVGSEAEVELANHVARGVEGVKHVSNDLKVDSAKAK